MILSLKNITKKYSEHSTAVQEVSFEVEAGEFTALAGPSGSGKTTLLTLSAGLDRPTDGEVTLLDRNLSQMTDSEISQLRRDKVGFVFQEYNLFPVLTALENVEYPLALKHIPAYQRKGFAQQALEETGCGALGHRFPNQLSGGQQQRIAIARAIVSAPSIVFADEPTANLDSETAKQLLQLFKKLNETKKITFLFSSHDPIVLNTANRVIHFCDGKITYDESHEENIPKRHGKVHRPLLTVVPPHSTRQTGTG